MHLEILTPEKTLFEGEAERIRLPGSKGSFEVLENHAPVISGLQDGAIRVTIKKGEQKFFDVGPGFVEVLNNKVIVLV